MPHLHPIFLVAAFLTACVPISKVADVKVLRGDYVIDLTSKAIVLLPITADGPFPITGEFARLTTSGQPELVVENGVRYKRFTIGKNICALHNKYSSGTVLISDDGGELVIDGELSKDSRGDKNHSGRYSKVVMQHPEVIDLTKNSDIPSLYGKYIFARGRFVSQRRFQSNEYEFDTNGLNMDESVDYDVVGSISPSYSKGPSIPMINVVTYSKVSAEGIVTGCRKWDGSM